MEQAGASPPKAEVDESPLHQAMDKNKESLKVKLMLRRPINQLVAQGIMPPLKTPPGFHEQRQKLERAKMGDLLRAKIQQRPDREELVRQHILEDVGHVDPSLAEKQRQLKKCRLADALNDQLSHRPGPLELIKKNILHTEEPIERAVKEGAIEFKATCEGTATKPTHPDHYMLDEDSSSLSPPPSAQVGQAELPPATPQGPIVTVLLAPVTLPTPVYQVSRPQLSAVTKNQAQRKKSKVKTAPKARTIKFHEYKGPPNAQKISPQSSPVETSYELLLQQQQLFLQWQLEWQHKYPQILLPASQKPATPSSSGASPSSSAASDTSQSSVPPPPPPLPQSPPPLRNLEDMKVSDLKAELKRRNLPVSGAKPQLIERLKPFSESHQLSIQQQAEDSLPSVCSVSSSGAGVSSTTCGSLMETECPESPSSPASVEAASSEDIIREQQRKIDHLQRQLTLHLHNNTFQVQQQSTVGQQQGTSNAKASLAAFLQQQQLNQQALQQQQQQTLVNNNNNNNVIMKQEPKSPPHRSGSLPTFIGTFMNNSNELIPLSNDNSFIMDNKLLFETKPMDTCRQDELMDVKSEIVDDVLEILIKNGELPASAAAEPLSLDDLDPDLMEVDTDWLDSLALSPPPSNLSSHRTDPLIGDSPSPFDLFIDDPDLKVSADWPDRIDFAI